jgi:hypothetical protein
MSAGAATYRRAPGAIWRATGHFLVAALPPASPTRVAGSAALVWTQIAEPLTLDEIVGRLADAAGAPAAQVRHDVEALFAELVPLGLVEVAG